MNKKDAVARHLKMYCTGAERAVHSDELEQLFLISGRTLRKYVSLLRQEGCPICSDDTGYYYAEDQDEINGTVNRLNAFMTKVSNARTGLMYARPYENRDPKMVVLIYDYE